MTEQFRYTASAQGRVERRAHVGVVSSGDLEILLDPATGDTATVQVKTTVSGYRKTWEAVLHRFFERHRCAVDLEIRDRGATPGTVALRLEQALELAGKKPGPAMESQEKQ